MDPFGLNKLPKALTLPPEYQALLAWKCTHQIFEDTAAAHPDLLAIHSEKRDYTYREVNELSDRIARAIVAMGLPVESMVGVYVDRSPEQVISFISVLKAGCCYVPLDIGHPADRLAYMMGEMKTRLVLTETESHQLGDVPGTEFISVAKMAERDPGVDKVKMPVVKPENLAYMIFTSGSTGRPKGVMLQHLGLVNFTYYFKHFHCYKAGERCVSMVRPGFDASMSEVAGFFCNGVAMCIPSNDVMANPARLVEYIVKNKVNRGFAPTPLGELLIEEDWPASGNPMVELQMGGEALRKRPTSRHTFQITNVYGPTENTNICTVYAVENADVDSRPPPMGYALANTQVLLLDENLKPVKDGEPGEMFLGGIQLARCYLNQPELTKEKFIPHPFDPAPGARLYRSGDLARLRPDGALESLGRIDFQVKIRGNRIELGEIDTVLNGLPGVKQAVVVPVMRNGKPEMLAAFWTAAPDVKTDAKKLEAGLREKLTEAMIPSYIICLEKFPLTPNGKIDRKALPIPTPSLEPTASAASAGKATVAPRDETEKQLLVIWTSVLNNNSFGVRDRFIDVGGTSLSALRIVSAIRKKLNRDIPVQVIYEAATIEKLAEYFRRPAESSGGSYAGKGCLVEIQPGAPGNAPVFCIHGFGGHIFQFYLLAKYLGPEVPVYALRGVGSEPGETADDSVTKMAARYMDAILPIVKGGPVHFVGYSMGGWVSVEIAHMLREKKHPVGTIAILDVYGPGYPVRLPFKERMKIHLHTMFFADWGRKKKYLAKRISNVIERIAFLFKIPYVPPEERHGTEAIIPANVFWAHRKASEEFRFRHFEGEIALLKAITLPEWPGNDFSDPYMGWGPYVRTITTHPVPGDHWNMVKEPGVQRIAEIVKERIANTKSQ